MATRRRAASPPPCLLASLPHCLLSLLPLLPLLLTSCNRQDPAPPTAPQLVKGPLTLTGTVSLIGTPPPPNDTMVACDPSPGAAKMLHKDQTVVVSPDGGLKNTFVFVTASSAHPSLTGSGANEPALVLDQVDCTFVPYALAIQVGQPLKIRNSDPTFHNVHWDPKLNTPINLGFAPNPAAKQPGLPAGEKIVAFAQPEFISVRCDVHPWMTSTIAVFSHPFFAVTDDQGHFTLPNLPPGTYTLTTYHPYYGAGTAQQVTLPPTSTKPANTSLHFTYQPK